MMTFGGLIAAYVVIADERRRRMAAVRTARSRFGSARVIIVCSSVTYHFAKIDHRPRISRGSEKMADRHDRSRCGHSFRRRYSLARAVRRGFYMAGNPYVGFLLHSDGRSRCPRHRRHYRARFDPSPVLERHAVRTRARYARKDLAQVVGWYWHFMGVLWLVLFILLGFWR